MTVQGQSAAATTGSAVSICSGLSRQACYGISESDCSTFGGSTGPSSATNGGGVASVNRAGRREIGVGIGAGFMMGLAGWAMGM